MPRAFQAPPEQVHPGNVTNSLDNPVLKRAAETLQYTWDGLASLNEHRATPLPEDNPARHARKVADSLGNFEHNRANRWDGVKAELKAEHRRIESELERAANLKPNAAHFNAIVGTFGGMNPGERARALDELIQASDGPTLATLLDAPAFVTGLTAEQRDNLKLRLFMKVNPAGVTLRDEVARALAKYEAGSIATLRACNALRQGLDRFDKRNREAEAVANKARTGFGVNA
jgi:hypothetical protein